MGGSIIRTKLISFSVGLLFAAHGLRAQQCSASTTIGRYVIVCDGFLSTGPNSPLVPAKLLATSSGDFNGKINGTGTISLGGQILTQNVVGAQKLNPDCTGTVTYTQTVNGQPGPPLNITFVVSEDGDRIDGLVVDPGAVFSCVLRRTSRLMSGARGEGDAPEEVPE